MYKCVHANGDIVITGFPFPFLSVLLIIYIWRRASDLVVRIDTGAESWFMWLTVYQNRTGAELHKQFASSYSISDMKHET